MSDSNKIMAIESTDYLCFKCLKRMNTSKKIHCINIGGIGYGSNFDNLSTKLQLCDECFNESQKDRLIWNMETVYGQMHFDRYTSKSSVPSDRIIDEYIDVKYKYDDEMYSYINDLPLQSKELVWNRFAYGACASYNMDAQDWIDYELGILSHDKCKEYGFYSPNEVNAYNARFPTCQHPVNIIYADDSKGCWCPFGANGKYGQTVDGNISDECYQCALYQKRKTPIIDVRDTDRNDYFLYMKYQLRKNELEKRFGNIAV